MLTFFWNINSYDTPHHCTSPFFLWVKITMIAWPVFKFTILRTTKNNISYRSQVTDGFHFTNQVERKMKSSPIVAFVLTLAVAVSHASPTGKLDKSDGDDNPELLMTTVKNFSSLIRIVQYAKCE